MQRCRLAVALVFLMSCLACASVQAPNGAAAPVAPEPAGGWQEIRPAGVAGLGDFANAPHLVIDGAFVSEHTLWNAAGCVWWTGVSAQLVVDLGRVCTVGGVVIQVAADNDYELQVSEDGRGYRRLCQIRRGDFTKHGGMLTVSSLPGRADRVPGMAFQPVAARYLKIGALGGVNEEYAVSEIQVFGACGEPPPP